MQTVTDFNRKSDDVFVKVIDYGEDKSGVDKFNIDIASGKGPDVFCIGGYQSLDNLRSKGVCENLNAFFEKDKEISKDDFIDSYIKATDFNGETYMISDSFQISTLVTRKNDYISDYECTIEGFEQYINSAGDDTKLLFTDLPQIDLFVFFAENSLKYYIDYEKKECKLNSFGFKEIMRICYDKGVEENDYEFVEMSEKEFVDLYKSGEALFMFDPRLGDMKRLRKMFGDDLCICGYPDMGSFFYPTNEICMNSKSNNVAA